MDQPLQRSTSAARAYQFHPGCAAIIDLFNLYLGVLISTLNLKLVYLPYLLVQTILSGSYFCLICREVAVKILMILSEILRKSLGARSQFIGFVKS